MTRDPMIVSLKKPERPDPSMIVRVGADDHHSSVRQQKAVVQEHRAARPAVAPHHTRRRIPGFVMLLAGTIILLLAVGLYASFASQAARDPSYMSQSDIDSLVAHVGTLILLPQGEEPTIATVTDLNALKGQAFFANAALGDKVLMYPKAQEAVLYDPSQDKVIQVAPLTVTGNCRYVCLAANDQNMCRTHRPHIFLHCLSIRLCRHINEQRLYDGEHDQ